MRSDIFILRVVIAVVRLVVEFAACNECFFSSSYQMRD